MPEGNANPRLMSANGAAAKGVKLSPAAPTEPVGRAGGTAVASAPPTAESTPTASPNPFSRLVSKANALLFDPSLPPEARIGLILAEIDQMQFRHEIGAPPPLKP